MRIVATLVLALPVAAPGWATAATVYPGCAIPALKSGHHTFYVDPAKGSLSGDGSAAEPWPTLADVVNPANKLISTQSYAGAAYRNGTDTKLHPVNPDAPVKAGDLILLRSGDHGHVTVTNSFNSDFITVAAAPGETPVVASLGIVSSGKWRFQGLKFQGTDPSTATPKPIDQLVGIGRGDWNGTSSDVVFDGNSFSTVDSTAGWSNSDWYVKPYNYSLNTTTPCTSITANHFANIMNGIGIAGKNTLVQGNTIEAFGNDGMDTAASDVLIKGNTIQGGVNNTSDPLHADGIQGWSAIVKGVAVTNTNVVIDGNILTKTGDPTVSYMQGISIFDGKWDGLVIENNVVDTNHWNAIAVYGATRSRIVNNTVMGSDPAKHPSWIQVAAAKDGTAATDVTVRNNISTQLLAQGTLLTIDHNIAAQKIAIPVNGTAATVTSGTAGDHNSVIATVVDGFNTYQPSAGRFDMRLRATSPAIGFGTPASAPPLDISGRARTPPIDAGAYQH